MRITDEVIIKEQMKQLVRDLGFEGGITALAYMIQSTEILVQVLIDEELKMKGLNEKS